MNRKIGLTGGIASGKSSVSKMLSRILQCEHIDVDDICRELLEPQAEGWRKITETFGGRYLTDTGTINRALLRRDLFASEKIRQAVNGIIHPLAKEVLQGRFKLLAASEPHARVLVEVPLLFEVKWEDIFDTIIVVYADHEICRNRLMMRDGVDMATAEKELRSQLPLSEKVRQADHVIDNSGSLPDTVNQVERLAELLQNNGKGEEKKLDSKK